MSVLVFDGVSKTFRSSLRGRLLYSLGPISFSVERGEIFGYLGPNGAGKTTTMKLAMGLLRPSSGRVLCFGVACDAAEAKRRVGFLPEQPYFYQHLTARELLEFYADMFGVSRRDSRAKAMEMLDLVGLKDSHDVAISKFSKGMLQRIGFAQALVNDPDLVVLDEPLTGLDPVGRREIRDLILHLRSRGKTVFISSHILQDVEMICDRVGILAGGKILRIASVTEVLESSLRWIEVEVDGLSAGNARDLGFADVADAGDKVVIHVAEEDDLNGAITRLISAGARIASVVPTRLTLEDYFLSQIGDRRGGPGGGGGSGAANPGDRSKGSAGHGLVEIRGGGRDWLDRSGRSDCACSRRRQGPASHAHGDLTACIGRGKGQESR